MGDPVKIEGGTAVKGNVPVATATPEEAPLPARVQEAFGQLVGAAREGLLALSSSVGLGVVRGAPGGGGRGACAGQGPLDPDRTAPSATAIEDGEVTLGGRRVGVERPRRGAPTVPRRGAAA